MQRNCEKYTKRTSKNYFKSAETWKLVYPWWTFSTSILNDLTVCFVHLVFFYMGALLWPRMAILYKMIRWFIVPKYKVCQKQGLVNLPSDRKHKQNLGAPHIFAKLRQGGGVKKRRFYQYYRKNIFLVLIVTFYIYKYYRNYTEKKKIS